jgi:PAS domain S-box-containing protein
MIKQSVGNNSDNTSVRMPDTIDTKSQQFFEQLLANSFDCTVLIDKNGIQRYVSNAVTQMLGYTPEELTNIPVIEEMLHPDDIASVQEAFTQIIQSEAGIIQYRHRHKNGNWVWLESRAINRLNNTIIQGIVITTRDITERKRVEEALRLQESYLSTIIENQPGLVWLKDKDCKFLAVNRAFAISCGLGNPEIIVGKSDFDIWPKELADKYRTDDISVMTDDQPKIVEELIFDKGEKRWFETFKTPVKDIKSEIIGTTGYARDITARKQAEDERINLDRQLNQMQKLESLGILAGGIAHDFNNMLGGIFGYIDLAIQTSTENLVTNYLSKALSPIDRARDLTRQLLTFAKGGAPVKSLEHLEPFIEEAVKFALSGSNVSARFSFTEGLWQCEIDKNQIGQVIDNIVINAVQAMPDGGSIEIYAENVTFTQNQHIALQAGNFVKISIEDHGIGIPKEVIAKIFDPFFTTKHKGHGLGLATSYSIIKRHDGIITVISEPGIGSTFSFFLPALPGVAAKTTTNYNTRHIGSGTFLIMDDEEVIRLTAGSMLESMGYTVKYAQDGNEAVHFFKSEFVMNKKIAGALFDLTIPGGLGGKDAIAQIRIFDKNTPVYVSSGYGDDPVMADPEEYGFTDSIRKPFVLIELAKLLNRNS